VAIGAQRLQVTDFVVLVVTIYVVNLKLKRVLSKKPAMLTRVFLMETVRVLRICNRAVIRPLTPPVHSTVRVFIVGGPNFNKRVAHRTESNASLLVNLCQ